MKKILLPIILIIPLIAFYYLSNLLPAQARPINLNRDPTGIKNSTLLIVVESIQSTGITLGYSMGTLVQYHGESFLVTHNHYGDLLQDMNIVEFHDAENMMIRPMYGKDFKKLILYQDAGTLVLRAPDGLADTLTPGSLEDTAQLKPGDIVQVAHRGQSNRDKVEVLNAVVEETTVSYHMPVYKLRRLDGQPLLPGDSGGGVWFKEKLVANSWSILPTGSGVNTSGSSDPTSQTLTDLSYAAIFPEVFQ